MKNKLSDLNNHLFAQIERLGDEDLSAEQIDMEAKRGEAMVGVADQIIKGAELQFKAASLLANHGYKFDDHLASIGSVQRPAISYDGSKE